MSSLEEEIAQGESSDSRVRQALGRLRRWSRGHPLLFVAYRTLVTVLGGVFVLAGLIMLVTPGPGWLAIFLGLGIWGTEFHWAHLLNQWAKGQVMRGWRWWLARTAEGRHRRALAGTGNLVPGPRHLRSPGA
ncbi:PGPGW domain-containing protein [Kocuria rosea]|uniref:PGPGW domain-containing protein n=1 Tax=Kocuria rosea TaxID=1275 RepID=UPI000DFB88E8|nr:PGPGW domain-containing protein [Kocuria rosea]STX06267.1 Putative transmembrane protein (PGPGW) [Kocuria rosea]